MCICVYMYVYIYIYIYVHVYIYIYMLINMCISEYIGSSAPAKRVLSQPGT